MFEYYKDMTINLRKVFVYEGDLKVGEDIISVNYKNYKTLKDNVLYKSDGFENTKNEDYQLFLRSMPDNNLTSIHLPEKLFLFRKGDELFILDNYDEDTIIRICNFGMMGMDLEEANNLVLL